MKLLIHTDGGARGNPGPAAIGVVIEDGSAGAASVISSFGKQIGETSNNVAEYTAVVEALKEVLRLRKKGKLGAVSGVQFILDSTLVVNQLNGLYKVKKAHLRDLLVEIRQLEGEMDAQIMYRAVPREQNAAADFLVNEALDRAQF